MLPCPDFRLPAVDGKTYARDDFADNPVLVVMFICNHCPYVQGGRGSPHSPWRASSSRAACSSSACAPTTPRPTPTTRSTSWPSAGASKGYGFPYLHDEAQDVARAFGAVCTPDIFVYDRDRRLAYRGRIDDSWKDESKVKRRELAEALDALVAGSGRRRTAAVDGVLDQMAATGSLTRGAPAPRKDGQDDKDPKDPWRAYLQRKGLKTTQQREAIVDAFLRSSGHVALEDLLSSARRKHPGVGLATVYRTVKLLEEAGIAAARHFGPGQTLVRDRRGAGAPRPPDLRAAAASSSSSRATRSKQLQDGLAQQLGFNVLRHRHELFGLCEKAQGSPAGAARARRWVSAVARSAGVGITNCTD